MTSYRIEDSEPGVRIIHGRRLYSAAWLSDNPTPVVRILLRPGLARTHARAVNKVQQ